MLIDGGAGAVGAYEAYLKSIGASLVIDYREAQFETVLQEKVDVVFDLVGGDTQKRSFLVLKEGGHLVSATQPVSQEEAARHPVSGMMMRLAPSADMLGRIARLLEEGTIRPDVANIYALQDAAQAWKDIAGNLPEVSWDVAQWAGSAKTQVKRQDRASSGLECKEGKIWPNEFMNYCCATFRKFLERVTLRSATLPSRNSTPMTVCCMSPQAPSLGTMPSINLQVI
jgi:hypothetical protein